MKRAAALASALLAAAILSGGAYAGQIVDLAKQAEEQSTDGKSLDAYETMRKAVFQVWNASPLLFRKALFVTSSPAGFGIYDPRPDNVFKQGEKIYIYVEPVGFGWEAKDGLNHAELVADLALKDGEGTVVGKQEGFGTFTFNSREQNIELLTSISFEFPEAPAGKYTAMLTFHDKVGDKSASFELPFEIK
jgi:hypothetical protein